MKVWMILKVWILIVILMGIFLGGMAQGEGPRQESLPPILGEPSESQNFDNQPPQVLTDPPPLIKTQELPNNPAPQPPLPPKPPTEEKPLPKPRPLQKAQPLPEPSNPTKRDAPISLEPNPEGENSILKNLDQALYTAKIVEKYLRPGKIWVLKDPAGELEIKGAIIYRGVVIGTISLNPTNGLPLPQGYHQRTCKVPYQLSVIKYKFQEVFTQIKVAEEAEFREPEASWIVPIIWNRRIVSSLKIYYDGLHIVPDYKAGEEMNILGQ